MAALKGSRTEQCLKDAFAGESQANRRYLYFANKADIEGHNEVADWFETLAKAERSHANRYQKALTELVYQFLLKRINIRRAMWAWFLGWHSYCGSGGQRR